MHRLCLVARLEKSSFPSSVSELLEKHGLEKPISFVKNTQSSAEEARKLMVRLTRHTGRKWVIKLVDTCIWWKINTALFYLFFYFIELYMTHNKLCMFKESRIGYVLIDVYAHETIITFKIISIWVNPVFPCPFIIPSLLLLSITLHPLSRLPPTPFFVPIYITLHFLEFYVKGIIY